MYGERGKFSGSIAALLGNGIHLRRFVRRSIIILGRMWRDEELFTQAFLERTSSARGTHLVIFTSSQHGAGRIILLCLYIWHLADLIIVLILIFRESGSAPLTPKLPLSKLYDRSCQSHFLFCKLFTAIPLVHQMEVDDMPSS